MRALPFLLLAALIGCGGVMTPYSRADFTGPAPELPALQRLTLSTDTTRSLRLVALPDSTEEVGNPLWGVYIEPLAAGPGWIEARGGPGWVLRYTEAEAGEAAGAWVLTSIAGVRYAAGEVFTHQGRSYRIVSAPTQRLLVVRRRPVCCS